MTLFEMYVFVAAIVAVYKLAEYMEILKRIPADYQGKPSLRKVTIVVHAYSLVTGSFGAALFWPLSLLLELWVSMARSAARDETPAAPVDSTQQLMDSAPAPEEMLRQQRRVLFALAPVLENELCDVHLFAVAVQLVCIARYKLKVMLSNSGAANPDSASGDPLRHIADSVARATMDDAAEKEYLAVAHPESRPR